MTPSQYEEHISQLEDRNLQLEDAIKKIVDAEKFVAKVTSGPEVVNTNYYYRILMGTTEKVVTYSPLNVFGQDVTIEVNSEVIISGDSIIAVLPKTLQIHQEPISMIKLVKWNQIGGIKSQVQRIQDAVEGPLKNKQLAEELGVVPVKGILLHGPPGCGKTMIGKAIAQTILSEEEVDADAYIYMKGPEVLAPYVGMAEATIRNTFSKLRNYMKRTGKRGVLFIDEADAILPIRGSHQSSDVDKTIVPAFLTEMDGFDAYEPLVLLATNRPEALDVAVMRPGRVDLKVEITRPTREDVIEIFEIHTQKVKTYDPEVQLAEKCADLLFGPKTIKRVSGAMVEAIIKMAATNALSRAVADSTAPFGIIEADLEYAYPGLTVTV